MKRIRKLTTAVAVLGVLAVPSAAHASASQVLRDCADDGALSGKYTKQELKQALKKIPSDLDEYSDCKDVIAGAVAGAPSGKSGGGSGGGGGGAATSGSSGRSAAPQPDSSADLKALADRRKAGRPEVTVGGKKLKPGGNGLFNLSSAVNGLPLPLTLTLVALGLLAIIGGLVALRSRIPALGKIPLVMRRVSLPRPRR